MTLFTGQQAFLNLVILKWTGAINMMQEDATVDKNLLYLNKVLYCLLSYSKHGLFMACDVNKRHFLHWMHLQQVESLQPAILDRMCVKSRYRNLGLPTDISVETLCWCPTWGPLLCFKKSNTGKHRYLELQQNFNKTSRYMCVRDMRSGFQIPIPLIILYFLLFLLLINE